MCAPYQYIKYPYQLQLKKEQLKEIFLHHLKINLKEIEVKPSPKLWGYRNKIHLHIIWQNNQAHFAYHQKTKTDNFIKVNKCFLIAPQMNKLLSSLLEIINGANLNGIKEVELKQSISNKEMLLTIYLPGPDGLKNISQKLSSLEKEFPLTGIVALIKSAKAPKEALLRGKNYLEDKIANLRLCFGAQSFFQINVHLVNTLIKDIAKSLPLDDSQILADLYCGTGTFGLSFAKKVKKVIGVEAAEENIIFLKKNIEINKIGNFAVYEGRSENLTDAALSNKPDILIVDPPRKGMGNLVSEKIIQLPVRTIVYISCNPISFACDAKILLKKYNLYEVFAYDFFPHTPHIEICAILRRGK